MIYVYIDIYIDFYGFITKEKTKKWNYNWKFLEFSKYLPSWLEDGCGRLQKVCEFVY